MPVLLVPLALIGAALVSVILLYVYEQSFGSPLEGLAKSVPVVGGYIAQGVAAAVDYGKQQLYSWTAAAFDTVAGWLDALTDRLTNLPAAIDAYAQAVVDALDHLTHVTVHEIVKAFVNPVRDVAHQAEADASLALTELGQLATAVENALQGVEGDIAKASHDVLQAVELVDLPNLRHAIEHELGQAIDGVAGDLDQLTDWASGWIETLRGDFASIPLADLIAGLATLAGLAALVETIARESGLNRAECRSKVKGICGTDTNGWLQLLGLVTPLIAFPGMVELVKVAQGLLHLALPELRTIAGLDG